MGKIVGRISRNVPTGFGSKLPPHESADGHSDKGRVARLRPQAEELEDEDLTILDLENIVLTGTIVERQKDRETRETKIVIRGRTLDDRQAEAVVKIGLTGVLYIITVYLI